MNLNQAMSLLVQQNQYQVKSAFKKLTTENLRLRLNEQVASAGFLFQHIGEAMHLLSGMFFGTENSVKPETVFVPADNGQANNLEAIQQFIETGFAKALQAIEQLPENEWETTVETPWGQLNKAQCVGALLHHNNYHLGQASLTLKKGK